MAVLQITYEKTVRYFDISWTDRYSSFCCWRKECCFNCHFLIIDSKRDARVLLIQWSRKTASSHEWDTLQNALFVSTKGKADVSCFSSRIAFSVNRLSTHPTEPFTPPL